jgi:hypothetical protein
LVRNNAATSAHHTFDIMSDLLRLRCCGFLCGWNFVRWKFAWKSKRPMRKLGWKVVDSFRSLSQERLDEQWLYRPLHPQKPSCCFKVLKRRKSLTIFQKNIGKRKISRRVDCAYFQRKHHSSHHTHTHTPSRKDTVFQSKLKHINRNPNF